MCFLKASYSKNIICIQKPPKWLGVFLFLVIFFNVSIANAILPFQEFRNALDPSDYVDLEVAVDPEIIDLRDRFVLHVKIELREGWHIYSLHAKEVEEPQMATKIFMNSGMFTPLGLWKEPTPVMAWDGALERVVKTHKQVVEFRRLYSATKSLATGSYPITGEIIFRACNNKICNLPKKISYRTKIDILVDKN
mgnify:CR=1 FL=1